MSRLALHATAKDLSRHAKDPMALALWMGIPLLIGFLVILAFGNMGKAPPRAKLLIVDEDQSFVSDLFVTILGREELRVIDSARVSLADGNAQLGEGKASALLVIPKGFGDAVLHDTPAELALRTNPAQSVLPQIVEQTMGILVDLVFYAQRILGDDLRAIMDDLGGFDGAPSDEAVSRISVAVNGVLRRAERYMLPPVLEIGEAPSTATASAPGKARQKVSLAVLFVPSIVLMALFFLATGISEDMWRERALGTLRRAVSAPGGVSSLFAGKLLAGILVATATSLVLLVIGTVYLDLDWGLLPMAVLWCGITGGVLLVVMCWVQMLAPSQRAGQVITNAITFPLLMLGGSFFPMELMPSGLATVGRVTPNGWSLEQLKQFLLGRADMADLLPGLGGMVLVLFLLYMLASLTLKRRFASAS